MKSTPQSQLLKFLTSCLFTLSSSTAFADDAPNFSIPGACQNKASGAGLDNPTDILPPQVTAYYVKTFVEPPEIAFLNVTSVYPSPSTAKTWAANIVTPAVDPSIFDGKFFIDVGYTPILNFFAPAETKGAGINAYSLPGTYIKPAGSLLFENIEIEVFKSDGTTAIADATLQFHSSVLDVGDNASSNLITVVADDSGKVALDCFLFLDGTNWVTVYDSKFDYLFDTTVTRTQVAPAKFAIINPGSGAQQ
ncbi:hypothetical protein [Marinobacter sp.]|uniref:hypothetical protein n=1 Tax=Gammaproteobacteria TaxID=1236 RepID=UPI003A8E6FE4